MRKFVVETSRSTICRSRRRSRPAPAAGVAVAVLVTATSWAGAASGTAVPAFGAVRQPSCSVVRPQAVAAAYGIKSGLPLQEVKPPLTVCTFTSNRPPVLVVLRIKLGETPQMFKAEQQQFKAHGDRTVAQPGFGQMAYSSAVGSGKLATSTLVVLKGSAELLISGTGPLRRAESLARAVLPKL